MIKKKGSKYQVQSEKGKSLGIYNSMKQAKKRLQQVEYFKKKYQVARRGKWGGVYIFEATYSPTIQARPPEDGKLREIKPDLNWLTVSHQQILPKPGTWKYPPLPLNWIYS